MSCHQDINAALSLHLKALGLPTAFENAGFTPTKDQLYVAEAYLPNQTGEVGVENGSSNDYSGLYQVSVMAPRDKTKLDGFSTADTVAGHFVRGAILTRNGIKVRIERVTQSAGLNRGSRWMIPVTVVWRAFAK